MIGCTTNKFISSIPCDNIVCCSAQKLSSSDHTGAVVPQTGGPIMTRPTATPEFSIDSETVQQALVRGRRERAYAVRALFTGRATDDQINETIRTSLPVADGRATRD